MANFYSPPPPPTHAHMYKCTTCIKVFNPVVKLVLENQPFLMPEPAEKPSLHPYELDWYEDTLLTLRCALLNLTCFPQYGCCPGALNTHYIVRVTRPRQGYTEVCTCTYIIIRIVHAKQAACMHVCASVCVCVCV